MRVRKQVLCTFCDNLVLECNMIYEDDSVTPYKCTNCDDADKGKIPGTIEERWDDGFLRLMSLRDEMDDYEPNPYNGTYSEM